MIRRYFILYAHLDIKKLIFNETIFKDSCENFVGSVSVNTVIVCFIYLVISTLFADNKYSDCVSYFHSGKLRITFMVPV